MKHYDGMDEKIPNHVLKINNSTRACINNFHKDDVTEQDIFSNIEVETDIILSTTSYSLILLSSHATHWTS